MPWKTCTSFLEKRANFPFFGLAGFLWFLLILNSGNSLKNQKFPKKISKILIFLIFWLFLEKRAISSSLFFGLIFDFFLLILNSGNALKNQKIFKISQNFYFFYFLTFSRKACHSVLAVFLLIFCNFLLFSRFWKLA